MGRETGSEERRLRAILCRIGTLVDEADLCRHRETLVATPLPVAVSVEAEQAAAVEQAAALLGVAPSTLEEYFRSGALRYFRMGRRKLVLLETLHEFARDLERAETEDNRRD